MNLIPFVRLPAEDLVPEHDDLFMDVGIVPTLEQLAWGDPLILKGPKGSGKTLAIEEFCAAVGAPRVRLNCSSGTNERDLIGRSGIQGESVFFTGGALTAAIDVANEVGACVLILEEINTIQPEFHSALFSVADFRQSVEVPSLGRIFKVNPGVNFWVVGTMNPGYGGTYHLNEALQSRFNFAEVDYMSEEDERYLLERFFSNPPHVAERKVVSGLMALAAESRKLTWDYALSTRDLAYAIRLYDRIGKERMLRILEAKFEPEHRDSFRTRVQSTFAVNPARVSLWSKSRAAKATA